MKKKGGRRGSQRGITFLDAILVTVIVGVLAAYAAMRMNTPGENTISYQAQRLARDIRHAQVLSATWGRPLQLTASPGLNGTYSVSCATAGAAPCDTSPVIDPVTGNAFSVSLQQGVTLAVSGTNPATFDTQGRPLNGGAISTVSTSYTLSAGSMTMVVAIAPITGYVSVTP